jgi:hypothetical protein|tara:strand:+ start:616 stop:768 length:153 start_codon:yes stop_codon:yes gene_type:complete
MAKKASSKVDVDVKKEVVVETPQPKYDVVPDAQGRMWKVDKDGKKIERAE